MVKLKYRKTIFYYADIILIIHSLLLLGACTKNNYISTISLPRFYSPEQLIALNNEKDKLNQESVKIVKDLAEQLNQNTSPYAISIHRLFKNLEEHAQIDYVYDKMYMNTDNDSLKFFGLKKLMESAEFYQSAFYPNKSIRKIINRGNTAYGIPKHFLTNYETLLFNKKNQKLARKHGWKSSSEKSNFTQILFEQRFNQIEEKSYELAGLCSEKFSRLIARVNWQKRNEYCITQLLPNLQKWDIVCLKSPGKLTDLLIPGYFGHAGIYLGSNTFVQSDQDGVNYINALDFLDGSDFIVLRPRQITEPQEENIQNLVKAQLGKKYDFNFNIESPDRIICTELIFLVFDYINWDTRNVMSWHSMSPDDLVKTSIKSEQIEIPLFLTNHTTIKNPDKSFIENLLAQN